MRLKWWDDLTSIPADSVGRRFLYAGLIAAGVTMTAFGSIFLKNSGPIPFKLIPDLRPVVLIGSGLLLALYASGGGARRRALALWGVVGYVIGFHLEEALVHWIGPFPGSITGSPVGLLGTSGSILALVGVLLMHVEVERVKLAEDLVKRGASEVDARSSASRLASLGARKIGAVALGVSGLGAIILAVVPAFGYDSQGGPWVLPFGGALLIGLALALLRIAPKRAA